MSKKALVIDGNSLIYRAFYATGNQLEYYKAHGYEPVNALKLVLMIVLKMLRQEHYDYVLMALDHQKKTLRHEMFAEYKAGRKPMPIELVSQLPLIKDAMRIIGVTTLSLEGIEADDIIGGYAKLMNSNDIDVEIFSSDKDMLQLVSNHTCVNLFKTGISDVKRITIDNFHECFFGIKPCQVVDFKGISGDSSDNLAGVKGIGPKTAAELINKYGSLEKIYESINELTETQQKKFIDSKESAIMCKKLSTIQLDIIDDSKLEHFLKQPLDKMSFKQLVDKYRFNGFEKYLQDIEEQLF